MSADDASILHRAIENNEIVPFFQPLVELRTGRLRGFEVLARWNHPSRGLVLPQDFIPLAEATGLNGLLTSNLLRSVFAAAKDIPEHLTLSVNVSLTQLTDRTLPRHICLAAEKAAFSLNRLILEITESALVDNTEYVYFVANELKEKAEREIVRSDQRTASHGNGADPLAAAPAMSLFFDWWLRLGETSPFQLVDQGVHIWFLNEGIHFARRAVEHPTEYPDRRYSENDVAKYAHDLAAMTFLGSWAKSGHKSLDEILDDRRQIDFLDERDRHGEEIA